MTTVTPHITYLDPGQDAVSGEVNVLPWAGVAAATNIVSRGVVVWYAERVQCCPGQNAWRAETRPTVNDSSGAGTWEALDDIQCEGCGGRVGVDARVLVDPTNEQIEQVAATLAVDAVARVHHQEGVQAA